jgi:hypothetical protein
VFLEALFGGIANALLRLRSLLLGIRPGALRALEPLEGVPELLLHLLALCRQLLLPGDHAPLELGLQLPAHVPALFPQPGRRFLAGPGVGNGDLAGAPRLGLLEALLDLGERLGGLLALQFQVALQGEDLGGRLLLCLAAGRLDRLLHPVVPLAVGAGPGGSVGRLLRRRAVLGAQDRAHHRSGAERSPRRPGLGRLQDRLLNLSSGVGNGAGVAAHRLLQLGGTPLELVQLGGVAAHDGGVHLALVVHLEDPRPELSNALFGASMQSLEPPLHRSASRAEAGALVLALGHRGGDFTRRAGRSVPGLGRPITIRAAGVRLPGQTARPRRFSFGQLRAKRAEEVADA